MICLGSNSVDETDKKIKKLKNKYPKMAPQDLWKEAKKLQLSRLRELKPKLGEVVHVIKSHAPYSEILYIKILPRHWWHPLSRELASMLDKHLIFGLKNRFRVKDLWPKLLFRSNKYDPDANMLAGMMDTDEIHLNGYGNRALVSAIIGPIVQKWLLKTGRTRARQSGLGRKKKKPSAKKNKKVQPQTEQ